MEVTEVRTVRRKVHVTIGSDVFVIPRPLFEDRPLAIGDDVDPEELDNWLLLRLYRPALEYAVSLLASRAYSEHELEVKLRRCGYRPAVAEMVLYKLSSNDLISDADFARQWVASRSARKLGRSRIAQELRRKGVSEDAAQEALDAIDEEKQLESAVELAQKALRRAKEGEDPRKTVQRTIAMLARRGFGYDLAKQAIAEAIKRDRAT